jgi:hypothetical protein
MLGDNFMSFIAAAGTQVVGAAVGPISIRSNLNADQPFLIDPFAEQTGPPPPPPAPNPLMSILKPEIVVALPTGPYTWAPYGSPSANYTPLILAGVGGVLFTILGIGGLVGRFVKPRTLLIAGGTGLAALAYVASRAKYETQPAGT